MVVHNCILIDDEPLAIGQIIKCLRRKDQIVLHSVFTDMDAFFASISSIKQPDIVIFDFLIQGGYNINAILSLLPKKCSIVITSVMPVVAYPEIKKQLAQFSYYELYKPFSNEKFSLCLNKVLSNLLTK
ncbi:hypothetical protein [Sphingobacterium siyangense]|uniref:hypothetical protein n=1 Tax=Sphingobacterium siyangense TaxID=459529 RepID=UPI00301A2E54